MKHVYNAEDYTFNISLNPPPYAGTVTWSLRDQGGVVKAGYNNTVIENQDLLSVIPITVPAAANTKTTPRESRFLIVNWVNNGTNYTLTYPYVIVDFLPIRVQASDVRAVAALNEAELDDTEIDLIQAANLVSDDIGNTPFMTALTAGDSTTDLVNQMIAYRAAIALGPSLVTRISAAMSVEGNKFSRLGSVSPTQMLQAWREEYDRLRTVLTNPDYVPVPFFSRSVRPPPKFATIIPPFAECGPLDWPFSWPPSWQT